MRTKFLMVTILAAAFACAADGVYGQDKKGWIPLLNGKDLTGWHLRKAQGTNGWKVTDQVLVNTPPGTDLQTDAEYYDFQLHVEFKVTPGDGNSGVYMRDKYEVQIFNSFGKPALDNGCGALYKKIAPSVNASKPEGEWQTYDITFIGRRLTVIHNGQKVHDNVDVGPMGTGAASNRADGPGPLRLQGDHEAVSFRNIRIRPLSKTEAEKLQKQIDSHSIKMPGQ
jgi:hypothetical protein